MFGEDGLTGLWVADMDFKVAPCITEALHRAVDFGVFGYVYPWQGYYDAVIGWEKERHGFAVRQDWIRFSPGVVPAFNWLMRIYARPGEAVLTLTPGYYPMLEAAQNNGRKLVTSALVRRDGRYAVDYGDFERKIAENGVKVFLLCSPHNPVCRVWEPEELRRMMDICRRYGVFVVSDEIHQDLVFGGHRHTPTALTGDYSDMLATLISPSKTFNLAGLQNASVILPDAAVREKYDRFTAGVRILYGNTLGYVAAEAAFRGALPWLEAVRRILADNDRIVRQTLQAGVPGIFIPELEGTYLLWLDFSQCLLPEQMADFFEKRCRLAMDYGNWFGGDPCCVRMNLATSPEIIRGAADTIVREYARLRAENGPRPTGGKENG